jgi:8-oxo-dGTP diphosphatase
MSTRYRNPALTVDAVALRGDRVLLIRRGRPPFRGMWAFPGGFVEQREFVERALLRELREETGLTAQEIRLLGVYSGPDRDPRKPTTSVAFLVRGLSGRLRGGDDAGDARWIAVRDASPLAFDHARILADALAARRGVGPTATWRRPSARFPARRAPKRARPRTKARAPATRKGSRRRAE